MKSLIVDGRKKARSGVTSWGASSRKQLVIPDQSLSIRTILERYTRGIPVDVKQYQGVYFDQTEFDLEKLNLMEFSDKMSIAERLKAKHDAIQQAYEERQAEREEMSRQAGKDHAKPDQQADETPEEGV